MSGPTFIKKNSREHLRVALDEYKGHNLVSLRVMYDPGGGEPLRPGREGFAVNVAVLPTLIAALIQTETEARSVGWLPPLPGAVCESCSDPFQATRADARFCSPKCRAKASRTKAHGRRAETNAGGFDPNGH